MKDVSVEKMRENLNRLIFYLIDVKLPCNRWDKIAKKQLIELGEEIFLLSNVREKEHRRQPYVYFRDLLDHLKLLQHMVNKIDILIVMELRYRFDYFNQFETDLATLLHQLPTQVFLEEDLLGRAVYLK